MSFTTAEMQFDPTYNYGDTDLSNDDNLVLWKFGELIKNLFTLSSEAKRQMEIIGIGATCEEMAEDFHTYFSISYTSYINSKLLTISQVDALMELGAFFDDRSGNNSPDFWNDLLLETNSEWAKVRQKASAILLSMGIQDLTLEFERTEKYEADNSKWPIMQTTKTRLVKK